MSETASYEGMVWRVPDDRFGWRGMWWAWQHGPILSIYGRTWGSVGDMCRRLGLTRPGLKASEVSVPYDYKEGTEWALPPRFWKAGTTYHYTVWHRKAYAEFEGKYSELARWLQDAFDIDLPPKEDFRTLKQLAREQEMNARIPEEAVTE